jgi:hypothetical protein
MDLADVLKKVEASYRGSASWTDPHVDREVEDAEYSRVTDPDRYRIVGARASAWERALVDLGLATAEPARLPDWQYGPRDVSAIRLRPRAADALELLVLHGSMESVSDTVISIGIGTPPVMVAMEPDCGCDACDSGSADLLDVIDQAFVDVVSGEIFYAEGDGWTLTATHERSQYTGGINAAAIAASVRRGEPVGTRALIGRAWLSAPDQ